MHAITCTHTYTHTHTQKKITPNRLLSICESEIGAGDLWAELLAHNLISALRECERDYVNAFMAQLEAVSYVVYDVAG
jgi:hypothetical protein